MRVHLQAVRGLEVGTTAPAVLDGAVLAAGTGAGVTCAGRLGGAVEQVSNWREGQGGFSGTFCEDGSKRGGAYLPIEVLAGIATFVILALVHVGVVYLPKKSCSAAVKEGGLSLYCLLQ